MPNNKQDLSQFGSAKPTQGDPQQCAQCEAMLTDALDGTLSAADQTAFDLHLIGCPACSAMMADAQRGAAWLEMLKSPRPEPPADLLDRILAQTTGAHSNLEIAATSTSAGTVLGRPTLVPGIHATQAGSNVLPFRSRFSLRNIGQTLLQPRLAMTAAMAFFSIALTMNLTGVRFTELRASDLRPSSIKRSISEANAHVVRYYDNLRVVYELESRVHELQSSSDSSTDLPANTAPATAAPSSTQQPAANPQSDPKPDPKNPDDQDKPRRRPAPGSSRREMPGAGLQFVVADNTNQSLDAQPYLSQTLLSSVPSVSVRRSVEKEELA